MCVTCVHKQWLLCKYGINAFVVASDVIACTYRMLFLEVVDADLHAAT